MATRNFFDLLRECWDDGKFVCVGLDSEYEKIPECVHSENDPEGRILKFNTQIIKATYDFAGAYKFNSAPYESQGWRGSRALQASIRIVKTLAPDVPIIWDAKRGDIGNTNAGYVKAAFDIYGADAVTVHPYLGGEALKPFLDQPDKGIIVLCRTSNEGAEELQDLYVAVPAEEGDFLRNALVSCHRDARGIYSTPLFSHVAYQVSHHWNKNKNCAVVVGATYPEELAQVRRIVGDMPILIPGIGAQGGDLQKTVRAGMDSKGQGMIINSSRGIIFASNGNDFAEAARREAEKLNDAINQYRRERKVA